MLFKPSKTKDNIYYTAHTENVLEYLLWGLGNSLPGKGARCQGWQPQFNPGKLTDERQKLTAKKLSFDFCAHGHKTHRVSLCSSDYPETHYGDHAGLKLDKCSCPCLPSAGIKGMHPNSFILNPKLETTQLSKNWWTDKYLYSTIKRNKLCMSIHNLDVFYDNYAK